MHTVSKQILQISISAWYGILEIISKSRKFKLLIQKELGLRSYDIVIGKVCDSSAAGSLTKGLHSLRGDSHTYPMKLRIESILDIKLFIFIWKAACLRKLIE